MSRREIVLQRARPTRLDVYAPPPPSPSQSFYSMQGSASSPTLHTQHVTFRVRRIRALIGLLEIAMCDLEWRRMVFIDCSERGGGLVRNGEGRIGSVAEINLAGEVSSPETHQSC